MALRGWGDLGWSLEGVGGGGADERGLVDALAVYPSGFGGLILPGGGG